MWNVNFAPAALLDLEEIVTYIAETDPVTAERFFKELLNKARGLQNNPLRGRPVHVEGMKGIRRFVYRNYRIFYRCEQPNVEILAILHTRRMLSKAWKARER